MRSLDSDAGRIDVWCAFPADILDASLLLAYQAMLSDAERVQQARFYFAKDRQRYLVTRALVRSVLSRYASVSPEQWIFSANAYGKPAIANVVADGADPLARLSFSITHADNLIVIGVTRDNALGLDTDNTRSRQVAALRALPLESRQQRFFEYWTLKEAYIKARGMGLSIPMNQFAFYFSFNHTVALTLDPLQNDVPERWRFWQYRLFNDYLLGVCAEKSGSEPPSLHFYRVVPLLPEQIVAQQEIHFLRASQLIRQTE